MDTSVRPRSSHSRLGDLRHAPDRKFDFLRHLAICTSGYRRRRTVVRI